MVGYVVGPAGGVDQKRITFGVVLTAFQMLRNMDQATIGCASFPNRFEIYLLYSSQTGSKALVINRRDQFGYPTIAHEIGFIREVVQPTLCERLILTGFRGQSAPLFDKFPSRRPHNIEKFWFSKLLLRMIINPCGEHTPQYFCLFYLLTFAF
jgi:hypothetical protein